jgi:anaerobic magnesium-protoporphyrin IX monomethyl ester cyclase
MRILLINPPWVRRKDNVWHSIASIMPPLGLAWIAAVLEQDGHGVSVLDAHAERLGLERIGPLLDSMGDLDIVGITATTALIANALEIARIARIKCPNARVILGGVHPTVLPEEVLGEPAVDIVVRGEGENTMRDLAAEKAPDQIDGISYREGHTIRHAPDRPLIKDLDTLPFPAYHLLPMNKYHPAAGASKRQPAISMLATRGCPGRCTFCYRIFGPRLRVRSGLKVAEEVKYLQENFGIREICFYDDTFTVAKKQVYAFCQALKEMKIDLTWVCFSRVDSVDEDMLRCMKQAGCHQILYGVEAASPEILRNIGKRANSELAEHKIQLTKKVGIDVRISLMFGNPGETEQTMRETLEYAIRVDPDVAMFNITTPFPGTDMFDWADKNGYLLTKDWDDYDLAHPVMNLPTVSAERVHEFYSKAYRKFYLRPRYIIKRVARLTSPSAIADACRGLKTVLRI